MELLFVDIFILAAYHIENVEPWYQPTLRLNSQEGLSCWNHKHVGCLLACYLYPIHMRVVIWDSSYEDLFTCDVGIMDFFKKLNWFYNWAEKPHSIYFSSSFNLGWLEGMLVFDRKFQIYLVRRSNRLEDFYLQEKYLLRTYEKMRDFWRM